MKRVLLISAGVFHPPLLARFSLRRLLDQQTDLYVASIGSLEEVHDEFMGYAAWVLYYHRKRISAQALARLKEYVDRGGGILAIHSTTASFKHCAEYFEVLGGRFIKHEKVQPFEVRPLSESSLFSSFECFEVRDEIYVHELNPAVQIHFVTEQYRTTLPVVWSYSYGAGRVLYAMPGHCSLSLMNRSYQRLLIKGLGWVSEGKED